MDIANGTTTNFTIKPQIELGSSATSYAPYSNICPISGRDSVAVERTSANYVTEYLNGSNIIADGSIVSNEQYSLALLPIKQGETYTASHNTESYWVWAFYSSKPTIGSVSYNNARTLDVISASKTFTAPIDGYIAVRVPVAYRELMVNGGSSALPYEPSYATDFTIQLGQTVYGADINWDTGVMTVISAKKVLVASDVTGVSGNQKRMNIGISGVRNAASDSVADDIIQSDKFKALSSTDTYNGNIGISVNTVGSVGIAIGEYLTLESAQQYVTANAIEVVYPLATPTTIQLTPTQLQMLKGYNRVTIDNGSIEVGYIAKLT
jgi:hypothetical protein